MSPQEIAHHLGIETLGKQNDLALLRRYDSRNTCALDQDGALIGLNLRGNDLQDDQIRFLFQIDTLQVLNLSDNQLQHLVLPAQWDRLRCLDLNRNPNLNKVSFDGPLPHLERLEVAECALESLHIPVGCTALHTIYVQKNKLANLQFEGDCPALSFLDASNNQLTAFALPAGFGALQYLYLPDNQLHTLAFADRLPALEILHLRNNALEDFKPSLLELAPQLEALYLYGNPLPGSMRGHLENNENASGLEYLQQEYFPDLQHGATPDDECKILLIGNGKVGKSCFATRLVHNEFRETWDSTHGIVLLERFKDPVRTAPYTFNIWDFGGQDIYHATHRLFMQSNAVYLVFWDWKTEHEPKTPHGNRWYDNHQLPYWLAYAKSLGKGSPIIVAQTKTAEHGERECPNQTGIRQQFSPLAFEHLESKGERAQWTAEDWADYGYGNLLNTVRKAVKRTQHKAQIPLLYVRLRDCLREKQAAGEQTLAIADYKALPEAQALRNPMDVLENWLTKTGVVFYRKGLFNDQIILDQAWAIRAVYTLFNRDGEEGYYEVLQSRKGVFNGEYLSKVWKKNSEAERELFVSLMLSCDMCFEVTKKDPENTHRSIPFNERDFVAPELLPDVNSAGYFWTGRNSLHLRYQHDFLHYGIIQSFIVRTWQLADMRNIWKSGILIQENDCFASIEAVDADKTIRVQVTENGKPLLDKIRNLLETLQNKEGVESVSIDGVHFVQMAELEKCHRNSEPKVRAEDGAYVSVKSLEMFVQRDEKAGFEAEQTRSIGSLRPADHPFEAERMPVHPQKFKPTEENMLSKNVIQELVADARLREALDMLSNSVPSHSQQDVIQLKARLTKLEREERLNIIDSRDAGIERAKITRGALDLSAAVPTPGSKAAHPPSPPPVLEEEESVKKILFVAANPDEATRLATDVEHRKLKAELGRGRYRERYTFLQPQLAATVEELLRAVNDKPWLLHFSGHGTTKGIVIATAENKPELMPPVALRLMLRPLRGVTELVVLNACYSAELAKPISELGMYVIGNERPISDPAAINFSVGFYNGLGEGKTIEAAYVDAMVVVITRNPTNADIIKIWKDGQQLNLLE